MSRPFRPRIQKRQEKSEESESAAIFILAKIGFLHHIHLIAKWQSAHASSLELYCSYLSALRLLQQVCPIENDLGEVEVKNLGQHPVSDGRSVWN